MEEYAIIVAGGSGTRMQSNTPKQYLLLAGKPVLMHTIEAFIQYSQQVKIILVLPESTQGYWNNLCTTHEFSHPIEIVNGGSTRSESVINGLSAIKNHESLVAIHDGVRPLVEPEIIGASYKLAQIHGSAIAATKLKESLRMVDEGASQSIDRAKYRSVQTPQTFKTTLIKAAYANLKSDLEFTDDASVAEKDGLKITLFDGSYENIKITTTEDLLFAESIFAQKNKAMK